MICLVDMSRKERCKVQARCKVKGSQFGSSVMIAVRVTEVQEVSNVAVRKSGDDRCKGHGRSGRVERNAVRFRHAGRCKGRSPEVRC